MQPPAAAVYGRGVWRVCSAAAHSARPPPAAAAPLLHCRPHTRPSSALTPAPPLARLLPDRRPRCRRHSAPRSSSSSSDRVCSQVKACVRRRGWREIPFANSLPRMLPVMRPAGLLLALLPLSNSLLAAPARARRSATPVLRRAVPVGVATLPDAAAPIAPGAALTTFLASASATTRSVHVLLCGRGRVDRQGGC